MISWGSHLLWYVLWSISCSLQDITVIYSTQLSVMCGSYLLSYHSGSTPPSSAMCGSYLLFITLEFTLPSSVVCASYLLSITLGLLYPALSCVDLTFCLITLDLLHPVLSCVDLTLRLITLGLPVFSYVDYIFLLCFNSGFLVCFLDGPADRAGVRCGDRILKVIINIHVYIYLFIVYPDIR